MLKLTKKTVLDQKYQKNRKINNEEGWTHFNNKMAEMEIKLNYNENERTILTNLKNTIGSRTITIRKHKNKESEEIKQLRKAKKLSKTQFQKACKEKNYVKEALDKYAKDQTKLKKTPLQKT